MHDIEQGSPEWHAIRCGKVTASRIADIIAKTQKGWGASRANYEAELIAERLTGSSNGGFSSSAMEWGTQMELNARDAYAFFANTPVTQIGFVDHPTIALSGASPDGLVGEHGLVEIKCPNTATHIATLRGKEIPKKYECQMMWQMACTGRQWCDFVSYDPRMPESMQLFIRRLPRDRMRIAELESEVMVFLRELDEKLAELRSIYDMAA